MLSHAYALPRQQAEFSATQLSVLSRQLNGHVQWPVVPKIEANIAIACHTTARVEEGMNVPLWEHEAFTYEMTVLKT